MFYSTWCLCSIHVTFAAIKEFALSILTFFTNNALLIQRRKWNFAFTEWKFQLKIVTFSLQRKFFHQIRKCLTFKSLSNKKETSSIVARYVIGSHSNCFRNRTPLHLNNSFYCSILQLYVILRRSGKANFYCHNTKS